MTEQFQGSFPWPGQTFEESRIAGASLLYSVIGATAVAANAAAAASIATAVTTPLTEEIALNADC